MTVIVSLVADEIVGGSADRGRLNSGGRQILWT